MTSLEGFSKYETKFIELWGLWLASLGEGEAAPDFLKKDKFMLGLCEPLWEKVPGNFPASYAEAVETAKRKKKKLHNNQKAPFRIMKVVASTIRKSNGDLHPHLHLKEQRSRIKVTSRRFLRGLLIN